MVQFKVKPREKVFNELLGPISDRLIDLCEEHNISGIFVCHLDDNIITSSGYLEDDAPPLFLLFSAELQKE